MSWLDILIFLPLLIGLIRGLMRGVIIELSAILSLIFGYIGARFLGAMFSAWLLQQFTWPEAVCSVVAYVLLFVGITIVINIIARLLSKLFKAVNLGWVNRLFGALFGIIKWGLIMLCIVLCLHRLDDNFHFLQEDLKRQSVVYSAATPLSERMWSKIKQQVTSFRQQRNDSISSKNEQK